MNYEEKEDWEMVAYRMKAEGFHYCFESYSSFENIKDESFHELRKSYLQAAKLLKDYVNAKVEEEVDDLDFDIPIEDDLDFDVATDD